MDILLIEDDSTIGYVLDEYFQGKAKLHICTSLEETMDLDIKDFDFIILDINLGEDSGLEYLKYVRSFHKIPILILTVRNQEEDILKAFRYGADDYLTKPFSLPVLDARINSILRRTNPVEESIILSNISLYPKNKTVIIKDKPLPLGPLEYTLLELLLRNRGLTIPRETCMETLWSKEGKDINDNTLSVLVKRLREKLGSTGQSITTIRGIGYRWEDDYGK